MTGSALTGAVVAAAVVLACSVFGLHRRRSDGRLRPAPGPAGDDRRGSIPAGLLATLGVDRSAPVTLLQFSTAFCAPCRATRVLCREVAAAVPEIRYVEVDAESQLDAVRALGVTRTPTLLLVDAAGEVVRRCVGVPDRAELRAVVGELVVAR